MENKKIGLPKVLFGKPIVDLIKKQIEDKAEGLRLSVFLDMNHKPSVLFVNKKKEFCESIGIKVKFFDLNQISKEEFLLVSRTNCDGCLVQLPIPQNLFGIQNKISNVLDIEGFGYLHLGKIITNEEHIVPCTVEACIKLLDYYNIEIKGKTICIINDTIVLGRTLALCLLNRGATPIICHALTKNIKNLTRNSDVIISGVGKSGFSIEPDFLTPGVDVLDVATRIEKVPDDQGNFQDKIFGDLSSEAAQLCNSYSPKIGGIGPITVAMVAYNLVKLNGRL